MGIIPAEIFVATLGNSPQVITHALDALLQRRVPICEVWILHPAVANPRIHTAVEALRVELPYYQEKGLDWRFVPFEANGRSPLDTENKEDCDIVLKTLYRELRAAKEKGYMVHLGIAGGRKIISAYGTVAAQLTFDSSDICWHVLENDKVDPRGMHPASPADVSLVQVPILAWRDWKEIQPERLLLLLTEDPLAAAEFQRNLEENELLKERLRFFQTELSESQQRVLALLALEGLENSELDQRLGISSKNQLTRIIEKYREWVRQRAREAGAPARGTSPPSEVGVRRLVADFHPLMLVLQWRRELPDLRPQNQPPKRLSTPQNPDKPGIFSRPVPIRRV